MIGRDLSPATILTPKAFENALRVLLAIGGSTNGIIHLTAIAGRLGIRIDLARLDRMARETPVLVDLKPSGQHYMEDLHRAGGLTTVMREMKGLLHLDALTVTGRTLGEELDAAPASFPRWWICCTVRCRCGHASTWTVRRSAPGISSLRY